MRRWALLLTLLSALTGSPMRHAEAASDLARLLMELNLAVGVETPDGGVGDDPGVGTLGNTVDPAIVGFTATDFVDFLPVVRLVTSPAVEEALWVRVWWPPTPRSVRHAWIQVFRF